MKDTDIPDLFPIPFGADAGMGFIRPIPLNSQIGINPGFASLHDGFVPLNFEQIGAGGIPPYGADMNGILYQVSAWSQWASMGGPNVWSTTLSSANGGYPKGAFVNNASTLGSWWISTIDDNTSNPDTGGADWIAFPANTGGSARVVTASGAFVLTTSDVFVGFNRTSSLASSTSTLPVSSNGKTITIQDLVGNFNAYPVTISPDSGHTIAGLSSWTLAEDRQSVTFTFYSAAGIWGVS